MKYFLLSLFLVVGKGLTSQEIKHINGKSYYYKPSVKDSGIPQFSGLTIVNNKLYTIANDHAHRLYEITLSNTDSFTCHYEKINSIASDFEGITTDGKNLFVLAEKTSIIYIINATKQGKSLEPYTNRLDVELSKVGFFKSTDDNFRLEGLAFVNDTTFLVAAELNPRGLALISTSGFIISNKKIPHISAVRFPKSRELLPENSADFKFEVNGKSYYYDFTDVFIKDSLAYVLDRSMECIYVVDYKNNFQTKEVWDFQNALKKEDQQGYKKILGTAEGLALDDKHIYVILDNNKRASGHVLFILDYPSSK
jgi:uncharacterized protein YjiK